MALQFAVSENINLVTMLQLTVSEFYDDTWKHMKKIATLWTINGRAIRQKRYTLFFVKSVMSFAKYYP